MRSAGPMSSHPEPPCCMCSAAGMPVGVRPCAARPAQDFKTAHLLGVCPRAQFFAMLLGSAASALVSVGAYSLYTAAWPVPGPEFPAPTAEIWLDMADLVRAPPRHRGLPREGVVQCTYPLYRGCTP